MALQVDVEDPRFKSLFTSHHYALDPTDPRFQTSVGSAAIAAEAKRRQAARPAPKADAADRPKAGDALPKDFVLITLHVQAVVER